MSTEWELITEVKDVGYYIGWRRAHPEIHMPEPMEPMSKASLVQIGGREGDYEVRGLTYAHSILDAQERKSGLKLFDERYHYPSLEKARSKAKELKKRLALLFDRVSRSTQDGKLVTRPVSARKARYSVGPAGRRTQHRLNIEMGGIK